MEQRAVSFYENFEYGNKLSRGNFAKISIFGHNFDIWS